ncbi:MAG: hypothetical protein ACJ76S_10335 [Solirubrobacteraceae bacterium]
MSFFDEGDERRRSPRPRRPAGGTVSVDPRTARLRQGIAVAGLVVVVLLLGLGIRGCVSGAKKRSLREYAQNVSSLVQESDHQVGKPFFAQLSGSGGADNALNLETQVNQLRVVSEDLVKRGRRLDPPGEMRQAQSVLLLVLEMRRDALRKIADKLPSAQATGGTADQAIIQVTGQMQLFYASDLLFKYRVAPVIKQALDNAGLQGQSVPDTNFFPTIRWLDAGQVANRLGATLSAAKRGGPVAPGSHGHALTSVSVGGTDLSPDTANRIPAGSNLTFTVNFQNQGDNDETGVVAKVSIEGAGNPVTAEATVPQTTKGSEASVDIPLRQAPPIGVPVTITVSIDPVPGEKMVENNKRSYPALFTRG